MQWEHAILTQVSSPVHLPPVEAASHIGKYRVIRRLAVGGMGEVFLARHEGPAGFSKTLVVKRILAHLASSEQFVELFLNEARLAAALLHPNIVQIFELGEADGAYFIAMEYIPGHSLRAVANVLARQGKTLDPHLAGRIAAQALHGLHYAHEFKDEQGKRLHIVHRDVSPDNILVGHGGSVKMLDFGVAKAMRSNEHTRTVRGKLRYMAPEQLRGEPLDARADLYSMGVVIYELTTGHHLVSSEMSPSELLEALGQPIKPPRLLNPNIPETLERIILRALAQDPEDRFPSAAAMATALTDYLSQSASSLNPAQLDAFLLELFGELALPGAGPAPARTAELMGPGDQVTDVSQAERDRLATLNPTTASLRAPPHPKPYETEAVTTLYAPVPEVPKVSGRRRLFPFAAGAGVLAAALLSFVLLRKEAEPVRPTPALAVQALPVEPPTLAPVEAPAVILAVPLPPPPRSPRPPREGRVTIRAHPWAEVRHGNKNLGMTPFSSVSMPEGKQTFVLKNPELGVEKRVTIKVVAGKETIISENLMKDVRPSLGKAAR